MLHELRPKLRTNLRYTVQTFGDVACYVLEDPVREEFWRIGAAEYRMLSRCDGKRSVGEIIRATALSDESDAFQSDESSEAVDRIGLTAQESESVFSWAIREGLFENLSGKSPEPASTRWIKRVNLAAFYRLSLGNPQPVLGKANRWIGFLTSPWLLPAWACLMVGAALLVLPRWDAFSEGGLNVISSELWWQYFLIWWGLKLVHEVSHGLTCLRYGGNVSQAGVLFLLFAPLGAYVDVTSSWRFTSKWKRIHVTLAGIIAELVVAAIATFVWVATSDPGLQQLCLQTILLATVATILFNGNPLIRFDGYYFLADLVEIPNLYQRGQIAVRQFANRVFFGTRPPVTLAGGHHHWFVFLFGIATAVWRVFLGIGIVAAAAVLFEGAGLVLALILAAVWFVLPIVRLVISVLKKLFDQPLRVIRAFVVSAALLACVASAVNTVTIPQRIIAPGVVRPVDRQVVRAEASGQVILVHVRPGERVDEGQLLLEIDNPDLELEVLQIRQELLRNRARRLRLIREEKSGELLAETKVRSELETQLNNRLDELAKLRVTADQAGVITDFSLDELDGRVVRRGDLLLSIADLDALEFEFSMDQSVSDRLDGTLPESAEAVVFLPGHLPRTIAATRMQILPDVRWDLESPALAAINGGPITVQEVRGDSSRPRYETVTPQIAGTIPLPPGWPLVPGVSGDVSIQLSSRTVAAIVGPRINQFAREVSSQLRLQELSDRFLPGSR